MPDAPMLSGVIAKIATQSAGGWKIALDVPESMSAVVKQLLGTENKIVYNISLEHLCEIEQPEKQKPGPKPKKAAE